MPNLVEFGAHSVDLDQVPADIVKAFFARTFAHKLGNEVAAQIVRKAETFAKEHGGDEPDDDTVDAWTNEARDQMVARILDGTISTRVSGGPRGNVLENIAWELAQAMTIKKLKTDRIASKLPSLWPEARRAKDGVEAIKAEDATVKFAGRDMTRDELVEITFNKYRDQLMDEAKIVRDERNAKAKANKAAPSRSDSVEDDASDLL